jgi:GNAT superfamily N-acetyltransferase
MSSIRQATINDILDVSLLWLRLGKEVSPNRNQRIDWYRSSIYQLMKNPAYCMMLAEDNGRIIGFGDAYVYPEPSFGKYIMNGGSIYIIPEFRNTTIGYRLYKAITQWAKDNKAEIIKVTCYEGKISEFYKKHGYKQQEITMTKDMGNSKCPFVK